MMSGTAFAVPPTVLPMLFSLLAARPRVEGCTLIVGPVLPSSDGAGRVAFAVARYGDLLEGAEVVKGALEGRNLGEVALHGASNTDAVGIEQAGRSAETLLSELWRMSEGYGVDLERLAGWMGFATHPLEPDGEHHALEGRDPGLGVPPAPPPLPSLEETLFASFGRPVRVERIEAALRVVAAGAPRSFEKALEQGIADGLAAGTVDLALGLEYAERLPSPRVFHALSDRAIADLKSPRPPLALLRVVAERTGSDELVAALARHRPVPELLEAALAAGDRERLVGYLDEPTVSGDQFRRAVALLGLPDREAEVRVRCDLDAPPPPELFFAMARKPAADRHAALAAVDLDEEARPGWALIRRAALAEASEQTGDRAPPPLVERLRAAPHKITTFWLERLAVAPA